MRHGEPFRHALPVNATLFHGALYLTHAGWERIGPGDSYPQRDAPLVYFEWEDGRTLPDFCLAWVLDGAGEIELRDHQQTLSAGSGFLVHPGQWHRHRPRSATGWTLMWIHFNGDEPLRWHRGRLFKLEHAQPVIENPTLFQAQFEHLLVSVHRNPTFNAANFSRQAVGLLSHFLNDSGEEAAAGALTAEGRHDPVRVAVEYIWNFSHHNLDVPMIARKAGIARRTLDRRFKEATGRSVLEEIQLCRLTRAAKLLEETALPVKAIVYRAGFHSEEHLRLAFQKSFGKSPQSYRKNAGKA